MVWALMISVGLNVLLFIPAYLYNTDKLTDLSYSLTFIIVAFVSFFKSQQSATHLILLAMVVIWALRLGGFLFIRINKMKRDSRFDEMRSKPWSFFRFWFFQGLSVFIVLAAALALWQQPFDQISPLSYLGWVIFGLGLILESVADYQKYRFNNTKARSTWIDIGIWRISRHPNYLGEIMVWIGVYIFCFTALSGTGRLLALASPIYITAILLYFSGVPLVEKSADKKWGDDKNYQAYKKAVPLLVPTPDSLRRLDDKP